MKSLAKKHQTDAIKTFNSTSRYLNNLLNIHKTFNSTSRYLNNLLNIHKTFDRLVRQIFPTELQLNKANSLLTPKYHFWFYIKLQI